MKRLNIRALVFFATTVHGAQEETIKITPEIIPANSYRSLAWIANEHICAKHTKSFFPKEKDDYYDIINIKTGIKKEKISNDGLRFNFAQLCRHFHWSPTVKRIEWDTQNSSSTNRSIRIGYVHKACLKEIARIEYYDDWTLIPSLCARGTPPSWSPDGTLLAFPLWKIHCTRKYQDDPYEIPKHKHALAIAKILPSNSLRALAYQVAFTKYYNVDSCKDWLWIKFLAGIKELNYYDKILKKLRS